MEKLYVIASFDWMDKEEKVGTLGHEYLRGSDVFSFEFDKNWLKTFPKIDFGQDLRPYTGVQYSRDNHIFGCFSDALPDRWGRRLIDLRTSLETEGKASHTLSDWNYLKGVEDELRMGGFRFKNQIAERLSALHPVIAFRLSYRLTNFYKLLRRLRKANINI